MFYKFICHIKCIIKKFFLNFYRNIKIGKKTTWRKCFIIRTERAGIIKIGQNTFFNNYCSITSLNNISIGNDCLFGENVKIYDHNHKFNDLSKKIKEQGFNIGEVKIGNNCWIGSNVVILKGADIGDNCVIGAGCVISNKIEKNTIVRQNNSMLKIEEIRGVHDK